MDRRFIIDLIFHDFFKAFDVVSHPIILKVKNVGVGGKLLVWIHEILFGRTLCVKVAGNQSSLRNVTNEIPQGSLSSSVLFFLNTNYIANSMACSWKDFDDDFKI